MPASLRLVLAGTVIAFVSCGGDGDDDEPAGYGADLRSEFVDECTEAGTPREACTCLYEALEAEVPFQRFQELDEQLRSQSADIPPDIEALAVGCAADPEHGP